MKKLSLSILLIFIFTAAIGFGGFLVVTDGGQLPSTQAQVRSNMQTRGLPQIRARDFWSGETVNTGVPLVWMSQELMWSDWTGASWIMQNDPYFQDMLQRYRDHGVDIDSGQSWSSWGVGVEGLVADIQDVMPMDELFALFEKKIATSEYVWNGFFGLDDIMDVLALTSLDKILEIFIHYMVNDPEIVYFFTEFGGVVVPIKCDSNFSTSLTIHVQGTDDLSIDLNIVSLFNGLLITSLGIMDNTYDVFGFDGMDWYGIYDELQSPIESPILGEYSRGSDDGVVITPPPYEPPVDREGIWNQPTWNSPSNEHGFISGAANGYRIFDGNPNTYFQGISASMQTELIRIDFTRRIQIHRIELLASIDGVMTRDWNINVQGEDGNMGNIPVAGPRQWNGADFQMWNNWGGPMPELRPGVPTNFVEFVFSNFDGQNSGRVFRIYDIRITAYSEWERPVDTSLTRVTFLDESGNLLRDTEMRMNVLSGISVLSGWGVWQNVPTGRIFSEWVTVSGNAIGEQTPHGSQSITFTGPTVLRAVMRYPIATFRDSNNVLITSVQTVSGIISQGSIPNPSQYVGFPLVWVDTSINGASVNSQIIRDVTFRASVQFPVHTITIQNGHGVVVETIHIQHGSIFSFHFHVEIPWQYRHVQSNEFGLPQNLWYLSGYGIIGQWQIMNVFPTVTRDVILRPVIERAWFVITFQNSAGEEIGTISQSADAVEPMSLTQPGIVWEEGQWGWISIDGNSLGRGVRYEFLFDQDTMLVPLLAVNRVLEVVVGNEIRYVLYGAEINAADFGSRAGYIAQFKIWYGMNQLGVWLLDSLEIMNDIRIELIFRRYVTVTFMMSDGAVISEINAIQNYLIRWESVPGLGWVRVFELVETYSLGDLEHIEQNLELEDGFVFQRWSNYHGFEFGNIAHTTSFVAIIIQDGYAPGDPEIDAEDDFTLADIDPLMMAVAGAGGLLVVVFLFAIIKRGARKSRRVARRVSRKLKYKSG